MSKKATKSIARHLKVHRVLQKQRTILSSSSRRIIRHFDNRILEPFRWQLDRSFDYLYGTDTSGIIQLTDLEIDSPNVTHGVFYEPTPLPYLRSAIRLLDADLSSFQFVDFGSGKGRILLQASRYPFSKLIGIEFSKELCDVAQRNVQIFTNGNPLNIEIHHMDAVNFMFPSTNLVLFFFHPFEECIFSGILRNLSSSAAQRDNRVFLIYVNAVHDHSIQECGLFPLRMRVKKPVVFSRKKDWIKNFMVYSNRCSQLD